MSKKQITITKIPIEVLMEILITLYEEGTDFIDIKANVDGDGTQDIITIVVRPEYMIDPEEMKIKKMLLNTELSDDDINELL